MHPQLILHRDVDALVRFIDSRQQVPHAWGRKANDCCSFPLAAVEAMVGHKPAPLLHWKTQAGAAKWLKHFGSIEAAFDAHFDRAPIGFATRGDIAGVPGELFAPALGVGLGIHPMIIEGMTLVGPGEHGNFRLPRAVMVCAWSATSLRFPHHV